MCTVEFDFVFCYVSDLIYSDGEFSVTGTIIASLGAIFIVVALTLVRYRHISGNSHAFAILQAVGSGALALSTLWQFNIGTVILETYCVVINVHTIYLNIRRKNVRQGS